MLEDRGDQKFGVEKAVNLRACEDGRKVDREEMRFEYAMVQRVKIVPVDGLRWQWLIAILFLSERFVQSGARIKSGPI